MVGFKLASVAILLLASFHCALSKDVPKKCNISIHYKELGCEPVFVDGEECPSSYNCDHLQNLNTDDKSCYFRGTNLTDFQSPSALPPCVPYAYCTNGYFMAGHIDCGHTFRLPEEECIDIRSGCCSKTVCGEDLKKLTVCYADGEAHYEGEKWSPKEDKCIRCRCDAQWDNSTSIYENKNCAADDCFQDFWHLNEYKKGCAPKYYGADRCCPSDTKCPTDDDKLIKAAETSTKPDLKCKFGKLELQIGDGVEDDNNCLSCKCLTPPLVECHWVEGCERKYY